MARKVEVRLVDDLDSGAADETVRFGLDGVYFEIDLSTRHAKELRSGLERFVQVAQRISQNGRGSASRRARSAGSAAGEHNQAIREWAAANGFEVATRGRIPRSVIEEYEATASRRPAGRRARS
jgi:Lsr2